MSSIPISINGTIVNFPNSGDSPNWSQAVIQAISLISQALAISSGTGDVPPQLFTMTSNVNTNVPITNLSFSTATVSGAEIIYNVNRATDAANVSETGSLLLNYDSSKGAGLKWQINKEYINDGAQITFIVTDTGAVQFSTTSIAGNNHVGSIFFRALAVLN